MSIFTDVEINELNETFKVAQKVYRRFAEDGLTEGEMLVNYGDEYIMARRCWNVLTTLIRMEDLYYRDEYGTDWRITSYWNLRSIVSSFDGFHKMEYLTESDKIVLKALDQ